jgi:hypothetical protein
MKILRQIINALRHRGLRGFCRSGLLHLLAALDDKKDLTSIESAWCGYLTNICLAVPGMLEPGNVHAMAFALKHLPSDAAMLEIGSFSGLSTCVLAHLKEKYSIPNCIFTCDD